GAGGSRDRHRAGHEEGVQPRRGGLMATAPASRRDLYPEIEPYRTGRLQVSEIHELYFEECGGPGGGVEPKYRRFFDPAAYRIVLFDQRGCGQSTPHAELRDNTTWHLVSDMEEVRGHLGIE